MIPTKTRTPERAQFLATVLTTAVEGGINYWSTVSDYRWFDPDLSGGTAEHPDGQANAYVTVYEEDGEDPEKGVTIGLDDIARALGMIRRGEGAMHESYRSLIVANDRTNGEAENHDVIDATCADIIVQLAVLGEVIYG